MPHLIQPDRWPAQLQALQHPRRFSDRAISSLQQRRLGPSPLSTPSTPESIDGPPVVTAPSISAG
jgi:hypothetical protein